MTVQDMFLILTVGILTNPANGQVSHTAGMTFGQTATYSCNPGYKLVGDINCTSATGVWSGSEPTCQFMLPYISHVYMCTVGQVFHVVCLVADPTLCTCA